MPFIDSRVAGRIKESLDDTWSRVNLAMAQGYRGLPGGQSLARMLYIHRGVRSPRNIPALDQGRIFIWAQAHFKRTGKWPLGDTGTIVGAKGETLAAVDLALARGTRELPGRSSLQ